MIRRTTKSRPALKVSWVQAVIVAAIAIVVVVGTVVSASLSMGTDGENSPGSEGYSAVGIVQGTHFWIDLYAPDALGVRTTGALGNACNRVGPFDDPHIDVCGGGIGSPESVFAYVVPERVNGLVLPLSDGRTASLTASLDVSATLPGKHMFVVIVEGDRVSAGAPEFD